MNEQESTISALREARRRRGWSQADLAARLGTTQSALARLEGGGADPRLSTVQRYADAVGATLTLESQGPSLERTGVAVRIAVGEGQHGEAFRNVIQFLDDVRNTGPVAVRQAVKSEPEPTGHRGWDALLAGIAEHVCYESGALVPGWASAPGRFLRRAWFVIEDMLGRQAPGLAALAFATTPAALAARGVFLDRSSLESV
jgi:transcriptional regulator with XRE-family HTH domain